MRDWGKIAVGTRMNDRCDPLFFNCWTRLIAGGMRPGDVALDSGIELPQHLAADVLVRHFLDSPADTLLMVDNDQVFPADTLARLRDDAAGQENDVLAAMTVTRRSPYYPIILRQRGDRYVCDVAAADGTVQWVDTVGTNFTLIRRSVFDALAGEPGVDGRWYFEWGDGGLGEDTRFCQRIKALGFRIAVHTGVGIGHRGPITFAWDAEKKITSLESFHQTAELFAPQK